MVLVSTVRQDIRVFVTEDIEVEIVKKLLNIRADMIQTVKMEDIVRLLYVFAVPGTGDCFVNMLIIVEAIAVLTHAYMGGVLVYQGMTLINVLVIKAIQDEIVLEM